MCKPYLIQWNILKAIYHVSGNTFKTNDLKIGEDGLPHDDSKGQEGEYSSEVLWPGVIMIPYLPHAASAELCK